MNDIALCIVNDGAVYPNLQASFATTQNNPQNVVYLFSRLTSAVYAQARLNKARFGIIYTIDDLTGATVDLVKQLRTDHAENPPTA